MPQFSAYLKIKIISLNNGIAGISVLYLEIELDNLSFCQTLFGVKHLPSFLHSNTNCSVLHLVYLLRRQFCLM